MLNNEDHKRKGVERKMKCWRRTGRMNVESDVRCEFPRLYHYGTGARRSEQHRTRKPSEGENTKLPSRYHSNSR